MKIPNHRIWNLQGKSMKPRILESKMSEHPWVQKNFLLFSFSSAWSFAIDHIRWYVPVIDSSWCNFNFRAKYRYSYYPNFELENRISGLWNSESKIKLSRVLRSQLECPGIHEYGKDMRMKSWVRKPISMTPWIWNRMSWHRKYEIKIAVKPLI